MYELFKYVLKCIEICLLVNCVFFELFIFKIENLLDINDGKK